VTDWLRRWSGRRTLQKIWLPLLRAKLGENYPHASAAFLWAIIARMYAARRTGLKKEMFGYVPGGYARVLERLGDALRAHGVDVRLRHAVRRIGGPESRDVEGVRVGFADKPAAKFDRVVLTAPCPAVLRICPELRADEVQRLQQVRYQGIVCASLVLRRPLAEYYVTNITDDGLPFTAVIEMTALVDPQALGGHALIYLPKYLPSDDPAFERPDDELRAGFLAGLQRMYPHFRPDDVLAFRVSRARHVLAISTLNYSDHLPPRATSIPGVFIANSAQIVNGTLNVNETVRLAEEAVPELLAAGNFRFRRSDSRCEDSDSSPTAWNIDDAAGAGTTDVFSGERVAMWSPQSGLAVRSCHRKADI
jgi:protoporphyrinogen oxidase